MNVTSVRWVARDRRDCPGTFGFIRIPAPAFAEDEEIFLGLQLGEKISFSHRVQLCHIHTHTHTPFSGPVSSILFMQPFLSLSLSKYLSYRSSDPYELASLQRCIYCTYYI
jgi:hypothetical protein